MDYERKLAELGKRYESLKREADTKKGALMNIVDSMKTEHGINTAEEAQTMIDDLEKKALEWETKRDKLVNQIESELNNEPSGPENSDIQNDYEFEDPDDDEFSDFEEN